jgi:nucleotide-binding universal stress UspA family protein
MKPFNIKKILVPTDFSETAGNALKQAINIAKVTKANLKLVHIVTPANYSPSESLVALDDTFYNKKIKKANLDLKAIAKEIKELNSISVEYVVKLGSIKEEVCDLAKKEKSDLIVMGTHGTSGVKEEGVKIFV